MATDSTVQREETGGLMSDPEWYATRRAEFEQYIGRYWRAEADIAAMYFAGYRTPGGDRKWLSIQLGRELGLNPGNAFTHFASEHFVQVGTLRPRDETMFHLMQIAQENAHYSWLAEAYKDLFGEEPDRLQITASRESHPDWEWERRQRRLGPDAHPAEQAGARFVGGGGASIFYGIVEGIAKLPSRGRAEEILDMASRNIVSDEIEHSVMEGARETEIACLTDEDWERAKASARESQLARIRGRLFQFSIPESEWDAIIEKYDRGEGIEPLTTGGIGSITSVLSPRRKLAPEGYLAPA